MKIVVQTDEQIGCGDDLVHRLEGVVEGSLARFEAQISHVEVHLSDLQGRNAADRDKCCLMEARVENGRRFSARHTAMTMAEAIHDAADKLRRALAQHFRRPDQPRGLISREAVDPFLRRSS